MLIILHRLLESDMRRLYDEVNMELSKRINNSILKTARGSILVGPDIKIEFRAGRKDKLTGLRPDYYNTDTYLAGQYLEQSVVKNEGRSASIMEIYSIIEGYIKRCEALSLERESIKTILNSVYGYNGGFTHKLIASKDDIRKSIKKVIFSGPATIVLWKDGTKTMVKLCTDEINLQDAMYEELRWSGLALCISKKVMGNTGNYKKIFKRWC